MRIAVMVLAVIGAIVVLTGVVFPLLSWLAGSLLWVAAGGLLIGGGIWAYRRVSRSTTTPAVGPGQGGPALR